MSAAKKPIKLFAHASGPNPSKIVILCEELQIDYELEFPDRSIIHTPVYEQHNPNGRVPCIIDPNTGLTIWESGVIIKYLIDQYDTNQKLTITTFPEKYLLDQYLFFQVSGQGPYFGQLTWFAWFHQEKIESVISRYSNEVRRVTKVLNSILEGKEWLVGGKCTYADLSYVPWYWLVTAVNAGLSAEIEADNPNFSSWIKSLNDRPAVKKAAEIRAKKMAEVRAATAAAAAK